MAAHFGLLQPDSSPEATNTPVAEEAAAPSRANKPGSPLQPAHFAPVTKSGMVTTFSDRPALDRQEAKQRWDSISSLVDCATGGSDCEDEFPSTDPSSHFFGIRDRILDEIDWFAEHQPVGEAQVARANQAYQKLLKVPDEMVQARAIEAMGALPPNEENPGLIMSSLPDIVDTKTAQIVIKELARYKNGKQEAAIAEYVANLIQHGANFASKELAKGLPQILTAGNRGRMERLLRELQRGERYNLVREALYGTAAT